MDKIKHSLPVKVTAVFLWVLVMLGFIGGTISICFFIEYDFYAASDGNLRESVFASITRNYANTLFHNYYRVYQGNFDHYERYQRTFSNENTNFLFVLKNEQGDTVLTNYSNQDWQYSNTFYYENQVYNTENYDYDTENPDENSFSPQTFSYTMECYVSKTLNASDRYVQADYWIKTAYSWRHSMIVVTVISMIASIVLFIFLLCGAGRKKDKEGVIPNGVDKIPFDLFLVIILSIIGIIIAGLENSYLSTTGQIILTLILSIAGLLLLLWTCMTFATRYKLGAWWKNTVIYFILNFIFNIIRKIFCGILYIFRHMSLIHKTVLIAIGISFLEFIILVASRCSAAFVVLWFLEKVVFLPFLFIVAIHLRKLQTGGQKIAAGDLDYHLETRHMFWDLKHHGENLNSIRSGMIKAVDERMKSERFKTELITNVSHDIKTPLTSIINYVDLIKKESIEDETLKEYVSVLDRQSARLKKLIEDLVDASKASTGNITVNMEHTDVTVLLTQAAGEYEERFLENDLELIIKKPNNEVYILADGRLLWRIFDNLLNNVCHYTQPSTRVYLDLEKINNRAVIIFRNISKYALHITSDELFERFVRGDSSRNTEGSGLGLSIAKSLTELQKGQLELSIDGDLFKVVLSFPLPE